MTNNCLDCGEEFIPFVTGHNLFCNACHSKIVNGLKPDIKKSQEPIENSNSDTLNSLDNEKLIIQEKSYHSIKYHNKFFK